MSDQTEMLEAALNLMEEGVALLDNESRIVFWNRAAEDLTGYVPAELLARRCPEDLYRIDETQRPRTKAGAGKRGGFGPLADGFSGADPGYSNLPIISPKGSGGEFGDEPNDEPTLVAMRHKLGHAVPSMLRKAVLSNSNGVCTGTALLFHAVEEMDKLPHGECGDDAGIERCQANMEDRLDAAHHLWVTSSTPFGLLWMTVDQAQELRRSHGHEACEAMLRTVEQTLVRQMKPAEAIGRWGCNEFLVLVHERTPELLLERARRLAGLARTADFRWWGDRVGLTVSIGASQAIEEDTLQALLNRVLHAMQASQYAGGNHVTEAREDACSKS